MNLLNKIIQKVNSFNLKYLIIIFLLGANAIFAQDAQVKISNKSLKKQFLVGDTIVLNLTIEKKKSDNISNLNLPTSKFELVDSVQSDTSVLENDMQLIHHRLVVSVYDSGKFYFPALKFFLSSTTLKSQREYNTDSIPFIFSPVEIDVDKDFKPIKDIEKVEFSILDYIYYIIGGVLLLAIILFLIFYFKRKKPEEIVEQIIPEKTPLEVATLALLELQNKNYPQEGAFKSFYTELTDIYRIFIHGKFKVDATEMTTSEIMAALNFRLEDSDYKELKSILELSDLVKFAKYTPIIVECEESFKKIQELIFRQGIESISEGNRTQH